MNQRRKVRRYSLVLPVTVQAYINNEPTSLQGETLDISTRGIYFRVAKELLVGMKLGLAMKVNGRLADGKELFILALGHVVRVDKPKEHLIQNLGVAIAVRRYEYFRDGLADHPAQALSALLQTFAMRQKHGISGPQS